MLKSVFAAIEKLIGKDPEYESYVRKWKKGGTFPCHLYPGEKWPLKSYYRLVLPEDVLGRCPECGKPFLFGPDEIFPEFYDCIFCDIKGRRHPLYCKQKIGIIPE